MRLTRWIVVFMAIASAQPAFAQLALKGAVDTEAKPEAPPEAPAVDPLLQMMESVVDKGNDAEMDAIVKFASAQSPDRAKQFQAMADNRKKARVAAQLAKVRDAPIYELWDGQVELGGFRTTGNTDNAGVSGALRLHRDGLRWRNNAAATADYQESAGITSRERYTGSLEANYKFSRKGYAVGIVQYENDRFLGYAGRYSASLGLGYRALDGNITLDLEAGPALRYTNYVEAPTETAIAARGSVDFAWKLSRTVSLDHELSLYADHINSSVIGQTALKAKLFGPLSARFSYNVQFESQPTNERRQLDTTSRASLVYDF